MSIQLEQTFPSQPSTERARRTPLSYNPKDKLLAYGANKQVIVRSVVSPETATTVYHEHLQPITSVSFSPSGFHIASGDQSGQVRVWNPVGDEIITKGPYAATSSRVNGLAWCGESQRILAVGDGKERYGHAFTADSGNSVGEISGHAAEVHAVAVRPCRPMRAVSVGEDSNAVFYTGPPFRFSRSVAPHSGAVSDVAYSPDGAYFATGSCDRRVALYDGDSGDFLKWLNCDHDGMVLAVSFASPKLLVTASADCSVSLIDIERNEIVQKWTLPRELRNQQTGVVAAPNAGPNDELQVISLGLNGDLYFWSENNNKPIRVIQGHQKTITALSTADEVITGSVDGTVVQWAASGAGVRNEKSQHVGPVSSVFGGKDVWSAGWDQRIIKFNHEGLVLTARKQPIDAVRSGNFIVALSDDTLEIVQDDSHNVEPKSVNLNSWAPGSGACVHAVGDLGVVGIGNTAVLFSIPALERIHAFDMKQSAISAVQISYNGELVAVGEASGKIALYATSGNHAMVTSRWTFHTSRVTSIAWSLDSKRVVTGASDTNIYVYNVERPARNMKVLGVHKDGVTRVAWTSENTFVSGGADAVVKTWRIIE